MIYLFSQIAISLALAAIVGGAAGWILHRARSAKRINELQKLVSQQRQQVNQAQTEVNIIAADFDDLKQASESEISELKKENKQIPSLNQNLEKSQLLVRQLMEKQKTDTDETNEENEKLLVKSRQIEDREKEIAKLQTELDIERRKSAQPSSGDTNTTTSQNTESQPTTTPASDTKSAPDRSATTGSRIKHHEAVGTSTEASLDLAGNKTDNNSNNSTSTNTSDEPDSNDDTLPNTAQTRLELAELRDQLAEDISINADGPASSSNVTPVSAAVTAGQHELVQTEIDDAELEQLFDTVEQRDDLKQIFGIGPVTEKTLNKLGITAYSQLAELKQHDIEKIANALQIFPGRIERDNWVGSARAQLEEVLEDL